MSNQRSAIRFRPGRLFAGVALVLGLALAMLGGAGPATAQSGPSCTSFGPGDTAGWQPCAIFPNVTITTNSAGSIKGTGDYYLQLSDDPNASAACSSSPSVTGDWIARMGGCGEFCFEVRIVAIPDDPTMIVFPSFTLYLPGGINAGARLDFVSTVPATANTGAYPGWHKICAPIREIQPGESLPSNGYGTWSINGSTAYDQTFNNVLHHVGEMQLPVDYTSQPSEVVAYDDLCMTPGNCGGDNAGDVTVTGCLKDATVKIECNGDGTYTLALIQSGFAGNEISLVSQTPGVTVVQSHQPWAEETTWTITGATSGQVVTLAANVTKVGGGGREGTDECCSGTITLVMPDCPLPNTGLLKFIKELTSAPDGIDLSLWHYPITVSCDNGVGGSFSLANGHSGLIQNITSGTHCTVHEDPTQIDLPSGCPPETTPQWQEPTYSPAQPVTIGVHTITTVTVGNVLLCVPSKPDHSVTIKKTAIQDGANLALQDIGNFVFQVNCQNPTSQQLVTLTFANGYQAPLNPLPPVNSVCTATEVLPQNPSVLPAGYAWLATPASQTFTVQPGVQIVGPNNTIIRAATSEMTLTKTCGPATPMSSGTDLQANCQITIAISGSSVPTTIVINDLLQGPINIPGYENKIVSMTSAQNWSCPSMPIVAGASASCQLPGSALVAAGGHSVINVVVQFHDAGNASETQNCVSATGLNALGTVIGGAPQVCASFSGTGLVCAPGTELRNGVCVPVNACKLPFVANAAGKCVCQTGFAQVGKTCLPVIKCTPPKIPYNDSTACKCPDGTVERGNTCVRPPPVCPPPLVLNKAGKCDCPDGLILRGKECVKAATCVAPFVPNANGVCGCPADTVAVGKRCLPRATCKPPMIPVNGGTSCGCPNGTKEINGRCVVPIDCRPPSVPNQDQSACICPKGTIMTAKGCVELVRPDVIPKSIDKIPRDSRDKPK